MGCFIVILFFLSNVLEIKGSSSLVTIYESSLCEERVTPRSHFTQQFIILVSLICQHYFRPDVFLSMFSQQWKVLYSWKVLANQKIPTTFTKVGDATRRHYNPWNSDVSLPSTPQAFQTTHIYAFFISKLHFISQSKLSHFALYVACEAQTHFQGSQ